MKTNAFSAFITRKEKTKKQSTHGTNKANTSNIADLFFKEGKPIMVGKKLVGITGDTVLEIYRLGARRAKKNATQKSN